MQRTLQPELLDSLPPGHPDAVHNRRDLRVINRVVGNYRWLARTLRAVARPGESVLELGAGTGELGRHLAARGIAAGGLDLWPRPCDWQAEQTWHQADLRHFEGYAGYQVVFGNLIFHQFTDAELAELGDKLRDTVRVIVACEPQRRRLSQVWYWAFARAVGANHVSRHDGHVSIAAGFVGDELPRLLRLEPEDWQTRCTSTVLGIHRMIAVRRV